MSDKKDSETTGKIETRISPNDEVTGDVVNFSGLGEAKKKTPINAQSQTGGFSSHMRPDLARSAVIYLEQEDPKRRHREKVVCAVNVGDFELRYPASPDEPEKMADDGRTVRRKMWDEAVQALIRVTADAGLNPKFVRNDKNSCRLTIKQEQVASPDQAPDEFFSMELFYCSEFELERRKLEHVKRIDKFDDDARFKKGEMFHWRTNAARRKELQDQIFGLERDKQFYLATTPDPREMDAGLIFKIELFTLKEYGVVKEKLRTLMGRYMDELSKVAAANGTAIPVSVRKAA
ncbi:MAG: hypothetical protein HY075_16330 [Deltaproteobacteria bacterium]|nr:hypothetical protein [Deltaproteobacteria bacterium]